MKTLERFVHIARCQAGGLLVLVFLFSIVGCVSAKYPPSHNQILVSQFEAGGLVAKEMPRGVVIYLPSVMFVSGSAQLVEESVDKVAFIAKVSNNNLARNREILVEGHADSVGTSEANLLLSERRAKSVLEMLKRFEMPPGRVKIAWFGESRPLLPNRHADGTGDPEARSVNRRVEFILLNP